MVGCHGFQNRSNTAIGYTITADIRKRLMFFIYRLNLTAVLNSALRYRHYNPRANNSQTSHMGWGGGESGGVGGRGKRIRKYMDLFLLLSRIRFCLFV